MWNGTTPDPALEIALQYEPTEYSFDATGERVWVTNKVPQPLNLETLFAPFLGGPFAYYMVRLQSLGTLGLLRITTLADSIGLRFVSTISQTAFRMAVRIRSSTPAKGSIALASSIQ